MEDGLIVEEGLHLFFSGPEGIQGLWVEARESDSAGEHSLLGGWTRSHGESLIRILSALQ